MNDMNRESVKGHIVEVLHSWGVVPSGRGSGVGDVDYWADVVLDLGGERPPENRGWEPYWIDKIGSECEKAGYHPVTAPPTPAPEPTPEPPKEPCPGVDLTPVLTELKALESRLEAIKAAVGKLDLKHPDYQGSIFGVKLLLKPVA